MDLLDDIKKVVADTTDENKPYRMVIVDDLHSLSGITQEGVIDRKAVLTLKESLEQMAKEHNISVVVMSRKPLKEYFPAKTIKKAFVMIEGKEPAVETILTD